LGVELHHEAAGVAGLGLAPSRQFELVELCRGREAGEDEMGRRRGEEEEEEE
jgi:hypothetical protein